MHLTDVRGLVAIDGEIEDHSLTPAEYEIVRRVILTTADFDYRSLVSFSDRALMIGAAALAARSSIVVDSPMVQAGILSHVRETFANAVYCATETITRPHQRTTKIERGMEALAQRYREGIFVIGDSPAALHVLLNSIEIGEVKPAFILATPAVIIEAEVMKDRLNNTRVPHIRIEGMKGNAAVAVAIFNTLVELAWQAYGQEC